MKIIQSSEFDTYRKGRTVVENDDAVDSAVKNIIAAVRSGGDTAVRSFASRFDRSSPQQLEVPLELVKQAADDLLYKNANLSAAMELAAANIRRFSEKQKEQFFDFECEMGEGLVAGQKVIPVEKAAVYVPAGRFPLFSSVLMGLIPAFCAGVDEVILASPPLEDGFPDRNILAAAGIALNCFTGNSLFRVFAIGGAQAIAALAIGTESVPRVDLIAGPGNKYVAAAKRLLYGDVGIDFIAGPSDVLVICDGMQSGGNGTQAAELIAADMIAQAEHDPDACGRALVSSGTLAEQVAAAIERQLDSLPTKETARVSLESNGLIVVYNNREEAVHIANSIAPEHLELQTADDDWWLTRLKNYGSLFIGSLAAEALGDYSAGINHTLPTSGSARFTGGLSVRHFLKTVTTLRCTGGEGFDKARHAAYVLAQAEGLSGHAASAEKRKELGSRE